jgi:hypothetical protein
VRPFFVGITLFLLASATQAKPRIDFAPQRALEPGEVVTVRWSGLPDGVDELEFLLQRDDGNVVRLTEQLLPSADSFGWIVPNLPSRRATLVLRAGIEAREVTLASSEPFVIHGAAGTARLRFRSGEWWTMELRPLSPDAPQIASMHQVRAARTLSRTRRPLLVTKQVDTGGAQPLETLEQTALIADTRCGTPRTIPQRK